MKGVKRMKIWRDEVRRVDVKESMSSLGQNYNDYEYPLLADQRSDRLTKSLDCPLLFLASEPHGTMVENGCLLATYTPSNIPQRQSTMTQHLEMSQDVSEMKQELRLARRAGAFVYPDTAPSTAKISLGLSPMHVLIV